MVGKTLIASKGKDLAGGGRDLVDGTEEEHEHHDEDEDDGRRSGAGYAENDGNPWLPTGISKVCVQIAKGEHECDCHHETKYICRKG